MTGVTVRSVGAGEIDDQAPPPGTAIVRPLRHVRAVRERHMRRFADPAEAEASRSARAWSWALGETAIAPVTDRVTTVPPSRSDINAEIAAADERRVRGERENRADAAATILRWLIGDDDHIPVRGENRGELVGGFGDIVRTPDQIAAIMALATEGQQRAAVNSSDIDAEPGDRQIAQHDTGYLNGVLATLAWVHGERAEAPISRGQSHEPTTINLKRERIYADDVIEQTGRPWMADRLPPQWYGEGVKFTITWLLGDSTTPPIDPAGSGPYSQGPI